MYFRFSNYYRRTILLALYKNTQNFKKMLRNALNICLISFFVIHLVDAGETVNRNRRIKRLGVGGRNGTQKFKKGENSCEH